MSDPAALLAFAELHKLEPGASRRAAISRAYYAAFHALQPCLDLLVSPDEVGKYGCARHSAVLKYLRTWSAVHPDKSMAMRHGADAIKCYHLMVACQEAREQSDYQLGAAGELSASEAVNIVGKASRVLKYAGSFSR